MERATEPFRGSKALPGGFVEDGERLEETAARELEEETGVSSSRLYLEQVGVYSSPDRDPRGRVITVSYLAIAPNLPTPEAGEEATSADWYEVNPGLSTELAFDHDLILQDALERARSRLEHTTIATAFCGEVFTIGDLQRVYEIVWGVSMDSRNFRRKVTSVDGFLEGTGEKRNGGPGRPGALYRKGPAQVLHPAMLRSRMQLES
ncbi:NUDIX domain-containing protein [Glycomyces terrestris]|uniref:NUDIX domain-containing protein n=2 Tax=Glycomyces terrestris TaxID=2493553 RepID=A0A426USQ4_9ACTN|nr:NUDIX domain-containing protein [Glycomyces terrestris]